MVSSLTEFVANIIYPLACVTKLRYLQHISLYANNNDANTIEPSLGILQCIISQMSSKIHSRQNEVLHILKINVPASLIMYSYRQIPHEINPEQLCSITRSQHKQIHYSSLVGQFRNRVNIKMSYIITFQPTKERELLHCF